MNKQNNKLVEIDLLQLHFYLNDQSHSMDAVLLNKLESDFLKISKEISKLINCKVEIESQAKKEGGLSSIFKFLAEAENIQYTISICAFVSTIIGNVLTNVISDKLKNDPETKKLEKEKLSLEIEKLKSELLQTGNKEQQTEIEIEINDELIDKIISKVLESQKLKIYRSNFYKNLSNIKKVSKVSTQILNTQSIPLLEEQIITRKHFKDFIIREEIIEPKYLENIELEIVSPVLKNKKISWRANYEGGMISFSLKDDSFKKLIINKGLNFNNGTKLLCDLEIKMKMKDDGELKETSKTVYNVTQIIYPNGDVVDV